MYLKNTNIVQDLSEFTVFQIKIVMKVLTQAFTPRIKDLRAMRRSYNE